MLEDIAIITLIVVVPTIPAYILYKTLPSRAEVKGPFKGLNIKLEGAFAGYFAVLLFLGGFFLTYSTQKTKYELWTVEGDIQLEQGGFDNENTTISIKPPEQHLYKTGKFVIEQVPLPKKLGTKKPSLLILKEGYETREVYLDPVKIEKQGIPQYGVLYDNNNKNISIDSTIILRKKIKPKTEKPYLGETAQEAKPVEGKP